MSRVAYDDAAWQGSGWSVARLRRPSPPPGYAGNTLVTEWLTVNCRGDWASRAGARSIRVRFSDPADQAQAVARFGMLGDGESSPGEAAFSS
jgi:hypothetical protein